MCRAIATHRMSLLVPQQQAQGTGLPLRAKCGQLIAGQSRGQHCTWTSMSMAHIGNFISMPAA